MTQQEFAEHLEKMHAEERQTRAAGQKENEAA